MTDSFSNSPETGKKPHPSAGIGVIFLTIFMDLVGFSIIFPLFPGILDYYLPLEGKESLLGQLILFLNSLTIAKGISSTFLTHVLFGGILGSLYSILQFLFSPVWGRLSDRFGRRNIMIITIAGTTFSYLLWIFSGSFLLLVLSRVISGITSGNLAVATAAVADVTPKKDRSKGMAIIGVAFGLGFILGPAIGGFSTLIDFSETFPHLRKIGINPFSFPALCACALSAFNWFWVLLRFRETLPEEVREKPALSKKSNRFPQIFSLQNIPVRKTTLVYFAFIMAFSGLEFTLTFLAVERLAYRPVDNTRIFLFIGFILILVQGGLVRSLAPRWGEKPLAIGGMLIGITSFLLLAQALTSFLFYTGLALLAMSIGLCSPTLTALVSLYAGEREQGRSLGIFRSAGSLARAIGPIVSALLYWFAGSRISYLVGAFLLLFPFLFSLSLPPPRKEADPAD